jgi:hypothetical protein
MGDALLSDALLENGVKSDAAGGGAEGCGKKP